jgi:hypothetical protein
MFSSIGNMFKKKQDVKKQPEQSENMSDMDTNDKTNNQYSAIFTKLEILDISMRQNLVYDPAEMFEKFFEEKVKTWK